MARMAQMVAVRDIDDHFHGEVFVAARSKSPKARTQRTNSFETTPCWKDTVCKQPFPGEWVTNAQSPKDNGDGTVGFASALSRPEA